MRLLGDNGAGYELAQRLEENSVWRAWLGEREYVSLQSYLLTPGTWSAFMQSENPNVIALQLRARALLFDKALVSLTLGSAATSPPSALDNSFLQLHADNVYFTLEHDVEDWTRLQAEKSPKLASVQIKHGLDSSVSITRSGKLNDAESGHGGINNRPIKASHSSQSASSALISPRQLASRTHAKTGFNIAGNALDHRALGDLWYTQYMQKDLMNRMNRLARRTAQRGLPFGDQEACVRTPMEMAEYVSIQATHRKRRPVFRIDRDSKHSLSSHERSVHGGDDGAVFMPENQSFANCVPENAVPARQNLSLEGFGAHRAFLDRLDHLRDLSSGLFIRGKDRLGPSAEVSNYLFKKGAVGRALCSHALAAVSRKMEKSSLYRTGLTNAPMLEARESSHSLLPTSGSWRSNSKEIGHINEFSDEIAQQLAEQAVVRLVAAAGFEGLKQGPLRVLVELLICHVQKLGSALRRIVDTYKTECSQAELLKMCINGVGGSKLEELMEYYAKSSQQTERRRPAPVQMPQQSIQQALVQQQISPHAVSMPLMMPHQDVHAQQLQPGYERLVKRCQSSSPGGSNRGDRFERVAIGTRPGGEIAIDPSTATSGLFQALSQPLSQGHLWSSQAPNLAGVPQVHQPPHNFKQQLSSLQIPLLQHNNLYVKDSGALKLLSPRIQGLADISVSDNIKLELDDQGEGSQFSPSRPKRKQDKIYLKFLDDQLENRRLSSSSISH